MAAKGRRAHRGKRDPSVRHFAVGAPSAQERLDAATAVGNLLVNTSLTDGEATWSGWASIRLPTLKGPVTER